MIKQLSIVGIVLISAGLESQAHAQGKFRKRGGMEPSNSEIRAQRRYGAEVSAGLVRFSGAVYTNYAERLQLGISYSATNLKVPKGEKIGEQSVKIRHPQVFARYFTTDSAYLLGAVGYRSGHNEYIAEYSSAINSRRVRRTLSGDYTQYTVSAGVGNQWQWDSGLQVGVEWASLNVPFGSKLSDNNNRDPRFGLNGEEDAEEFNRQMKTLSNNISFYFLTCSVGYSF